MAILEKQVPNLELCVHWGPFEFNANRLRLLDGVFIQRPSAAHHLELIVTAREHGLPVWIDLDDDVFLLPDSNPNHYISKANNLLHYTSACLGQADLVTVTTETLAQSLKKFSGNIRVIPNAFDDPLLLKHKRKAVWPRKPIVVWRGSNTHDADVSRVARSFSAHAKHHPEWTWVFMGHKPWMLTPDMPDGSFAHIGWQNNLLAYFHCLNKIQPSVVIVPLEDHAFNRSKSNIAWIEASFANAVTLAPDWEEWRQPGVCRYSDPEEFAVKLDDIMGHVEDLEFAAARSWKYIEENLFLTRVNSLRREALGAIGFSCPEFIEELS